MPNVKLASRHKWILALLPALVVAIYAVVSAQDHPQTPFASDGCTMIPDRWHYNCCYIHDHAYWQGGSAGDRMKADQTFRACVADISGNFVADAMYSTVRISGHPVWPTPWRWDFGRPYKFGY